MDVPVMLRPAAVADTGPIAAIWHHGWRDGHLGHVPDALLPHRGLDAFRSRVPGQLTATTVALVHGRIVGFVTVHDDEIEQLYVAAPARGTGAATTLLRHGERVIAANHDRAWLAVAPGNSRARHFYEREGWHDAGALDYEADTANAQTVTVPCRRYETALARQERKPS